MEIEEKFININHMTRSSEKMDNVKYIVIKETMKKGNNCDDEINLINSFAYQDEIYYSVHYIIEQSGKCVKVLPEYEVSYFTNNIKLNYNCISIACSYDKENGEFECETTETLIKLLIYLKKKYNLKNENILLEYDLTGNRNTKYYIDNKFKFYDILEQVV